MKNRTDIKVQLFQKINELVDARIETSKAAVTAAKESKNNETKSTAGDKYETGRAMMQLEQEKNEMQLRQALHLKASLKQMDFEKISNEVGFGNLVITTQGKYFISIGIGKVKIEDETYFVVSLDSPVGKLLAGKKIGDKITIRDRQIEVKTII